MLVLAISMVTYQANLTPDQLNDTNMDLSGAQHNLSVMFNENILSYSTDSLRDIAMRMVYKVVDAYSYIIFEVAKLAVNFKTMDFSGNLLLFIIVLWVAIPILVGLVKILVILIVFISDLVKDRKEKKEINKLRKLKRHKEGFKTWREK
jgi:hypothetical protein